MKRAIVITLVLLLLGAAVVFVRRLVLEARWDRQREEPGAALLADIAAFEARRFPRPPLFGEAVPGTAWEHYREAARRADE